MELRVTTDTVDCHRVTCTEALLVPMDPSSAWPQRPDRQGVAKFETNAPKSPGRHVEDELPAADSNLLEHRPEHRPEEKSRWPTKPVELKTSWGSVVADIISVLCSVPFVALAIVLMRIDGKRVDEHRQDYINSILVVSGCGPTN